MKKTCGNCGNIFEITSEDIAFLEKLSPVINGKKFALPVPKLCPDCREQRRLAALNERNLYRRKCDLTGRQIISNIHQDSPYKVYDQKEWYSDAWDPLQHGLDFDFSRSFFEQFKELSLEVPCPNLFTGYQYDENSDFTNYAGKNKNCYLIFNADENRDCYYCMSILGCTDCLDSMRLRRSERCYECIDSINCYGSAFLQECVNCSDSAFLKNCIGCKNCLMCTNLRNKEYWIDNKPSTKEMVEKVRALFSSHENILASRKRFEELKLEYPQKQMYGFQNENVLGDYLMNCKNARHCFDSEKLWDCAYIFRSFMPLKDSMDCEDIGDGEKLYETCCTGYNAINMQFCAQCLDQISDIIYSSFCFHSSHLFGCFGMNRKQYCILNKQYTKEEYEKLVPKIVEHMKVTGEWGEFFPVEMSMFTYNESSAISYYPLSKDEVIRKGWKWRDDAEKQSQQYLGPETKLPDDSKDAEDSICERILTCEVSSQLFKIIPQELKLYHEMQLPLPRRSPNQRQKDRMAIRNPRRIWTRPCMKCGKEMQTTFSPERPEIVYCEQCYEQAVI